MDEKGKWNHPSSSIKRTINKSQAIKPASVESSWHYRRLESSQFAVDNLSWKKVRNWIIYPDRSSFDNQLIKEKLAYITRKWCWSRLATGACSLVIREKKRDWVPKCKLRCQDQWNPSNRACRMGKAEDHRNRKSSGRVAQNMDNFPTKHIRNPQKWAPTLVVGQVVRDKKSWAWIWDPFELNLEKIERPNHWLPREIHEGTKQD